MNRCVLFVSSLTLLSIAAACDDTRLRTARGTVSFRDPLHSPRDEWNLFGPAQFESGDPIIAGTRFCPEGAEIDTSPVSTRQLSACFDISIEGEGAADEDGCLEFAAPGTATWRFEGKPCGIELIYVPINDELVFEVVAAVEARADYFSIDRVLAAQPQYLVPDSGRLPEWSGGPYRVVDRARFPLIFHDASGRGLYWSGARERVEPSVPEVVIDSRGDLVVEPGVNERPFSVVDGTGAALPIGTFARASASEVASLEIIPLYARGAIGEDEASLEEGTTPIAARAVVRDRDGEPLHGVDVEWALVRGELALAPFESFGFTAGRDLIALDDACVRPPAHAPKDRRATIAARYNGIQVEYDLTWRQLPDDSSSPLAGDGEFVPSPDCQAPAVATCACRQSQDSSPLAVGFVLIFAAGWRRRRSV